MENAALHYLKRFPSSSGNLRRVLWRKVRRAEGFAAADEAELKLLVEQVTQRVIDAGLVDDEAYGKLLAQSLHNRGLPLRAIAGRLREKSLPAELIERCLARLRDAHSDVDELAAWTLARRKRLGPFRKDATLRQAKRQRDLAAMARAGFGYDVARRIIDADVIPDER